MKQIKRICLPLIALLGVSAAILTGCKSKTSDPTTLNVVCLNAGYGDSWIKSLASKWESQNHGYKINLTTSYEASSLIQKHLASKNNADDLYISVGAEWKSYAAQGYFLNLDDLLSEKVDGSTLKERVNPEYQKSLSYVGKDGTAHAYRLPWTAGVGGIYYNAKMFADNGWKEPTTYAELLTLINTIKTANLPVDGDLTATVKPFVYTGQNTDYFDYAVFTWWAQLAGKEAIDAFLNYKDASVYDASISGSAYAKLEEATTLWHDLFKDPSNYVEGSISKSNHQAQQNFLNGYSAMMFDGEWLYNEMLGYTSSGSLPDSFQLKIMKTPTAPNAVDSAVSYVVGEDQYIAIPASSSKADLAKSFIKEIVSDEGCQTFLKEGHGMMAYQFDSTGVLSDNPFISSLTSYRKAMSKTFTNYSSSLLYLSNIIDIWGTSAMRPFEGLLSDSNKTVASSFDTIKSETSRNWETWKKQAGM